MCFVLLLSLWVTTPAGAASPPGAALPAHATLIAAIPLPGDADTYAVSFQTNEHYLGVVSPRAGIETLIWSALLPERPAQVSAPGPAGLFIALVRTPRRTELFALRDQNGNVRSAIAGSPHGLVRSDLGIVLRTDGFELRAPDRAHLGSVRYRWVTPYTWTKTVYAPQSTFRVPDYPRAGYPRPNAVVRTSSHDLILIRLEIAGTAQQRATGLMNRHTLDADSGMIFAWGQETQDAFWMENTYIPLTVAFLARDGTIQELDDMAPLSTELHAPEQPYFYALEANQGYFASNGIRVGDRFVLSLG